MRRHDIDEPVTSPARGREAVTAEPRLRLALPAAPGSVAIARRAVAEEAERVGMERSAVDDLRTAVSEACANVVLHAYPYEDSDGSLEVELSSVETGVDVVVRDHGGGIRPRLATRRPSLRLGLGLIGTLASTFQLTSVGGRGTEVRIQMPLAARGPR
jgi:anti-sigma regulatory factor (Ser/Thr protein kinase)